MPSSTPFVDPETGVLDRDQLRRETEPLVKLVGLFATIALLPVLVAIALGNPALTFAFTVFAWFVLAVGAAVTLMYVIARALTLSNDESAHAGVRRVTGDGHADEPADGRDDSGDGAEPGDDADADDESPNPGDDP